MAILLISDRCLRYVSALWMDLQCTYTKPDGIIKVLAAASASNADADLLSRKISPFSPKFASIIASHIQRG